MELIAVYLGLVAVGDVAAFAIGELVDRLFPSISMAVFLTMLFSVYWLAWTLAVRLTEKRAAES